MKQKDLLDLKQQIDVAKTRVANLKGKKEGIMESLKANYDCSTIKEAEDLSERLLQEATDLETEIEDKLSSIRAKFDL